MGLFHRFRREAVQLCCCNRLDFAFGGERRDLVEDSPVGFGGVVVRQPAENHFRVQRVVKSGLQPDDVVVINGIVKVRPDSPK